MTNLESLRVKEYIITSNLSLLLIFITILSPHAPTGFFHLAQKAFQIDEVIKKVVRKQKRGAKCNKVKLQ